MKPFDLNLLKTFAALMQEGSATRAAVQLGVTQAAVSAALARLRDLYDDPLFTRTPGGLEPTVRAMEIAPLVREALSAVERSLGGAPEAAERYLRLGLSDDFEIAFGAGLIAALRARFPFVRPVLRQTYSAVAAEMLRDRQIDIAIGSGGLTGRGLQRLSVGEAGYCSLSAVPGPLTPADFLQRDHLLISSGGLVGIVDEALAAMGEKRRVAASTSHFAACPYLLAGTDWIATLPTHAAKVLAARHGLHLSPCPISLRTYPIEVGMTIVGQRDSFLVAAQTLITDELRLKLNDPAA
jgi:DNA-binding transcriptional LysR family regulator